MERFVNFASQVGKFIIEDVHLPYNKKTYKPTDRFGGIAGEHLICVSMQCVCDESIRYHRYCSMPQVVINTFTRECYSNSLAIPKDSMVALMLLIMALVSTMVLVLAGSVADFC